MAAKDWVGDRDQGWAGPFLPRGEVVISVIFCLKKEVSGKGALSKIDGPQPPPIPNATLPGRPRSQSLWPCLEHGGRRLRPPGPAVFQRLPQPPRLLPQVGPLVPPPPAANKNVKDLSRAVPSPLVALPAPLYHYQLTGCGGTRRGLARAWMMPLKAMMSHTMTRLTTTAPGACRETRVRLSG